MNLVLFAVRMPKMRASKDTSKEKVTTDNNSTNVVTFSQLAHLISSLQKEIAQLRNVLKQVWPLGLAETETEQAVEEVANSIISIKSETNSAALAEHDQASKEQVPLSPDNDVTLKSDDDKAFANARKKIMGNPVVYRKGSSSITAPKSPDDKANMDADNEKHMEPYSVNPCKLAAEDAKFPREGIGTSMPFRLTDVSLTDNCGQVAYPTKQATCQPSVQPYFISTSIIHLKGLNRSL